jgi:hypothetical protein
MSISPSTLLALQKAGEGLHAARQAFAQEVQSNAGRVVGIVASEPFSAEADRAFTQLRAAARMAHELQSIEEQLKTMYGAAAEMTQPETPVIVALPDHGRRSRAHHGAENFDDAQDVVVKPAPQRQSPRAKPLRKRTKQAATQPQRLSSNDEKVLVHLKKVLDRRSWVALTQGTIAHGVGIPLGSVGLAMRRLVAAEAVRERGKGSYRLA